MEYRQLTIDDWLNIKENLRKQLQDISEGFVRIGYQLKQIKEQRLYERDGYKDLTSFAKAEYSLSATTVSRFMAINTKYSIDGNSEYLRPEFTGIGSSKLGEMLTIKDEDMELIGPATTRESIRDLKHFEKEESQAAAEEAPDRESILMAITEEFFRGQEDLLNEICSDGASDPIEELVNPSGNRTFRTGIYFVSFFDADKGIKVKAFGQSKPETYTWDEFEHTMDNLFECCGKDTWKSHYKPEEEDDAEDYTVSGEGGSGSGGATGGDEKEPGEAGRPISQVSENLTEDVREDIQVTEPTEQPEGKDPETEEILPEPTGSDDLGKPNEPEIHDRSGDEPEEISPEDTEVVEEAIAPAQNGLNSSAAGVLQEPKKQMRMRWEYIKTMNATQAAAYLSTHLSTSTLKDTELLTGWLYKAVEV